MNDDEVRRSIDDFERALLREAIAEVERGLAQDDPAFVRHIRNRQRAELVTAVSVFLLLAAGVVLLTAGAATASWPVWLGGIGSFVGAFAADAVHRRTFPPLDRHDPTGT
jgi:Protein of unknown function (DUF3040)